MKVNFMCVGLLFSSLVMASDDVLPPKSISVINLSDKVLDLWVNGEYRELKAGVALLQPCLPGENVELQVSMDLSYIPCGGVKEIEK